MKFRSNFLLAAALGLSVFAPIGAAQASGQVGKEPMVWTTLGTAAGPVAQPHRSEPANLLTIGKKLWLVDCGDGTVERLASLRYRPARISAIFISHLHMDHIGGLQGLLGLRWMLTPANPITIYGPPGTDVVVAGILQSMKPATEIREGLHESKNRPEPEDTVKVVIVKDGSDMTVDGVRVRAAHNSHFDDKPGHTSVTGTVSLSYRFDYSGYGIGFTGDTGPSQSVAHLFKGADLMVSEVQDLPGIIASVNGPHSPIPPIMRSRFIEHMKTQHLTPQQAGSIATEAGVKRLVFTHLSTPAPTDRAAPQFVHAAHETFKGGVEVAHDLDTF